jgi:hypothetical protein
VASSTVKAMTSPCAALSRSVGGSSGFCGAGGGEEGACEGEGEGGVEAVCEGDHLGCYGGAVPGLELLLADALSVLYGDFGDAGAVGHGLGQYVHLYVEVAGLHGRKGWRLVCVASLWRVGAASGLGPSRRPSPGSSIIAAGGVCGYLASLQRPFARLWGRGGLGFWRPLWVSALA